MNRRTVLVAACLVVTLVACGKNNNTHSVSTTTAAPTTTTSAPIATAPPLAPPAGMTLTASVQKPTLGRADPVRGFLTAVNNTGALIHLTFPGGCDVGLILYRQGVVVAHSDSACTSANTDYDMKPGETRISGFGNTLVTAAGTPPPAGVYDLGVVYEVGGGPWQAKTVPLTLT